MNQFTQICLNTFILFFVYWLFVAIVTKASKAIRKSTSKAPPISNHFETFFKFINEMKEESTKKTNNDYHVKLFSSAEKESEIGSDNFHEGFQNTDNENIALMSSELKEINPPVIEEFFEFENLNVCGDFLENSEETSLKLLAVEKKGSNFCDEDRQVSSGESPDNKEKERVEDISEMEINEWKLGDKQEVIEEQIKMDKVVCEKLEDIKQNKPEVESNFKQHFQSKENVLCSLEENKLVQHATNNHEDSANKTLFDQIQQYKIENEHLRSEIGEVRSQMKRLEECESDQKREIKNLKIELEKANKVKANVMYLRSKESNNQEQTNENVHIQVNDAKQKMNKTNKKMKVFVEENQDQTNKDKFVLNSDLCSPFSRPRPEKVIDNSNKKEAYRFLSDCCFVTTQDKAFLYGELENLFHGSLKTEKFYNSKQNESKNPHAFIDNLQNILLIIELENGKIIGAYTQCAFTPLTPHSVSENIAYLFDISNMKSFHNRTGKNSINYSINCVTWGMNELTMSFERANYLMTNFGSNGGIFWDGEYRREDLVGVDRDWVGINQYEIFRITSE